MGSIPVEKKGMVDSEVQDRLLGYLISGSPVNGTVGLTHAPIFLKSGSGEPGDSDVYEKAVVIPDRSDMRGVPSVQITDVFQLDDREEWGDDQWIYPMQVVLDCIADEYSGALSRSGDPMLQGTTADQILKSAVVDLLDNDAAMAELGFGNVRVAPGAGQHRTGVSYHNPVTAMFDAYVDRV